jgi:hypothetical protein
MIEIVVKVILTALIVVAIGELGKRSSFAGALLASLPLTSLLALIWLYRDTGDSLQAAQMARGIFWLVLPSLLFFLVFPLGVKSGWGFWPAMAAGCVATVVAYGAMVALDRSFELRLFG